MMGFIADASGDIISIFDIAARLRVAFCILITLMGIEDKVMSDERH